MADVALGLASVFCGCQANVYLLELIIQGSPDTYYALTCAQYVCVALLTLPLLLRWKEPNEDSTAAADFQPFRMRRSRISTRNKLILAVAAWVMSVGNNIVFSFDVSVPLHATFRSSSLMVNMLTGYLFLGKRFTAPQVVCALTICGGLIALTMEKARKAKTGAVITTHTSTPTWYWACGVGILVFTTFCTAALGVFQEYMYRDAKAHEAAGQQQHRPHPLASNGSHGGAANGTKHAKGTENADDAPPMWAEALCCSHLYAIPLFFLQPVRLYSEFQHIQTDSQVHVLFNCLTQLVCIAGVYVMNNKTSAFTLTLTLTLRKLASVTLSVFAFGHYRHFSLTEWVAITAALAAGTAYPFLPKAAPAPAPLLAATPDAPPRRRSSTPSPSRSRSRSSARRTRKVQ